ncbi:hypothetical protein BCR43DRAFT_420114, partial [Syncephalastrum racemosum]
FYWRCVSTCACKASSKSGTTGTFFFNRKASFTRILWCLYDMLTFPTTMRSIQMAVDLHYETVSQIYHDFHEMMRQEMEEDDSRLGGPGVTCVQIDESKFGKRKYHQGHRVEGVWVLGMVEKVDGKAGKCFFCTIPAQSSEVI